MQRTWRSRNSLSLESTCLKKNKQYCFLLFWIQPTLKYFLETKKGKLLTVVDRLIYNLNRETRFRQVSRQHNREIEKRVSYFPHCELCSKALKSSQESLLRTFTKSELSLERSQQTTVHREISLQRSGLSRQ